MAHPPLSIKQSPYLYSARVSDTFPVFVFFLWVGDIIVEKSKLQVLEQTVYAFHDYFLFA